MVQDSKAERGWFEARFEDGFEGRFAWGPLLEDESDVGFWSEPPQWMIEQDPVGVAPQGAPMASAGPVGPVAPVESADQGAVRETAPVPEPGPAAPEAPESVAESAPDAAAVLDPESGPVLERVPVTVPARGEGWTIHMVRAEQVLLSLGKESRQLHLGVYEARRLVDKAAEWLRRGMPASEMRYVLSSALPQDGVKSAVGFLMHRLKEKMPPEPGHRRDVSPEASRPQGVDGTPGRDRDPAPEAVAPPPLLVCEGPGDEHMFRAYGGHVKCGECRQTEAYERWAAQREAAARARGEDGLTGDGKGGWRDRLAELAASRGGDG
ncbi:hypothetical protein ACFYPN_11655 [Streptomyces sp. NPDC005576]|uniref:hypothetical protein n=1 Tax=Streptomyces sp. NPDC005576 TaxID=3364726 RepID=UPI0036B98DBD